MSDGGEAEAPAPKKSRIRSKTWQAHVHFAETPANILPTTGDVTPQANDDVDLCEEDGLNADTAVGDAVTTIPTDSEIREQIHQDRKHAGLSTDNSSDMSRSAGEAESNEAASDTLATWSPRSRRWSFCPARLATWRRQRAGQPAAPPDSGDQRRQPVTVDVAELVRQHERDEADKFCRELSRALDRQDEESEEERERNRIGSDTRVHIEELSDGQDAAEEPLGAGGGAGHVPPNLPRHRRKRKRGSSQRHACCSARSSSQPDTSSKSQDAA